MSVYLSILLSSENKDTSVYCHWRRLNVCAQRYYLVSERTINLSIVWLVIALNLCITAIVCRADLPPRCKPLESIESSKEIAVIEVFAFKTSLHTKVLNYSVSLDNDKSDFDMDTLIGMNWEIQRV